MKMLSLSNFMHIKITFQCRDNSDNEGIFRASRGPVGPIPLKCLKHNSLDYRDIGYLQSKALCLPKRISMAPFSLVNVFESKWMDYSEMIMPKHNH